MVTETSGFDHVTKIDRQSSAMTDTRRVVDVVVLVQTPAGQAGYRRALHGQPPRRGGGWRRDVQAGASWTAEKDNARANPQRISALPRLHPLSIGVSGRLLKTAGEPACERLAARKGAAPSQAPRVCEGPYLLRHMLPPLRRARREVSERRAGTRAQRTSCVCRVLRAQRQVFRARLVPRGPHASDVRTSRRP